MSKSEKLGPKIFVVAVIASLALPFETAAQQMPEVDDDGDGNLLVSIPLKSEASDETSILEVRYSSESGSLEPVSFTNERGETVALSGTCEEWYPPPDGPICIGYRGGGGSPMDTTLTAVNLDLPRPNLDSDEPPQLTFDVEVFDASGLATTRIEGLSVTVPVDAAISLEASE